MFNKIDIPNATVYIGNYGDELIINNAADVYIDYLDFRNLHIENVNSLDFRPYEYEDDSPFSLYLNSKYLESLIICRYQSVL